MTIRQIMYFPIQLTGLDFRSFLNSFRGLLRYISDGRSFYRANNKDSIPISFCSPCTKDWYEPCGSSKSQYFIQDLLVARKIFKANPKRHIDVGSRIDGFVAHVASYRVIEEIDIRSNPEPIPNVIFRQADFMEELPDTLVECCDSASCLHALEHFGLGRYGDSLNPDGHLMGIDNLWRMLKPGGRLYLSVPVGNTRVEFNSQRIFSIEYLVDKLAEKFSLVEFSYIDDNCVLHENIKITTESATSSFGCNCGCGIFLLRKN